MSSLVLDFLTFMQPVSNLVAHINAWLKFRQELVLAI